jgi:hypothetical protein
LRFSSGAEDTSKAVQALPVISFRADTAMWLGDVEYSRGAFQCAPLLTRLYLY